MKCALLVTLIAAATAACPNGCSGNGICGANDKCSCFQNWQAADCSLRTCTYSLAWADTADGTNSAHYYAECSNKGICDRKTAECKCFDGYEGKGCRRSTCPEKCSGHGTCEYIDELAGDFYDRRTGPGNKYKATSGSAIGATVSGGQAVPTAVTRTANTDVYHGFLYDLWDAQKIQGCKCDLGYDGPDCSHRISPKGDDPLTTVKSVHSKQVFQVGDQTGQFIMVYHDPYGGVWRTDGIDAGTDDNTVASNVQYALRSLPNQVLDGATAVAASGAQTVCHRAYDGVQHIAAHTQEHLGSHVDAKQRENGCGAGSALSADAATNQFTVSFADKPGQTGVQYLMEVVTDARGAGSFPVSAGVGSGGYTVAEVYQAVTTLSELAECSDRGLDNGDGECECFDGFRGLACEEQEALV